MTSSWQLLVTRAVVVLGESYKHDRVNIDVATIITELNKALLEQSARIDALEALLESDR